MKLREHRTLVAAVLTFAAIALPGAAWYFAGSHETARVAEQLERKPVTRAAAHARSMAERLAARLEALREAESRRPFYHYQNLYHDPKGASEGLSVVPSPLAEGPGDPLVRAHFQIAPSGLLSLPTYNDEVQEGNQTEDVGEQRRLQQELAPLAAACRMAVKDTTSLAQVKQLLAPPQVREADQTRAAAVPQQMAQQTQDAQNDAQVEVQAQRQQEIPQKQQALAPQAQGAGQSMAAPNAGSAAFNYNNQNNMNVQNYQVKEQTLDNEAWVQNSNPNKVYQTVKNRGGKGQVEQPKNLNPVLENRKGDVTISVGPLQWRTLAASGRPALFCLREVLTPDGALTQGFELSAPFIEEFLRVTSLPLDFRPGPATRENEVDLPIDGAQWHLAADLARAAAEGRVRADDERSYFLWSFLAGAVAAVLSGLVVVGLVWQSERLALQRSQFAASAAHELRTPLAGLRMYGEMLAEGLGDPARSRDYARRIADEAERLGRVVGNVLNFARLERGTLNVRPQTSDLAAALREGLARQAPALAAAGAKLEIEIPEQLPAAHFDREAFFQILQNLLDNAEKYTREAADRTIRVALAPVPRGLQVSVADRGPGIPPDLRRRLFQPFARGGSTDAPAGLGLGLALSLALARAQGGQIECDPAPSGATFRLILPEGSGSGSA